MSNEMVFSWEVEGPLKPMFPNMATYDEDVAKTLIGTPLTNKDGETVGEIISVDFKNDKWRGLIKVSKSMFERWAESSKRDITGTTVPVSASMTIERNGSNPIHVTGEKQNE